MDPFSIVPSAVVLLPVSWLWFRFSKFQDRLDNTYGKQEVKEIIDLKNQPIVDAVDRIVKSQDALNDAISQLRLKVHKSLCK